MNKCQNCGQMNDYGGNFCRFCGIPMVLPQNSNNVHENYVQPRPYMWKTDEYQINDNSAHRKTDIRQVQSLHSQSPMNPSIQQSMMYPKPAYLAGQGYQCPRCRAQNIPYVKRQISTAGWITFAVLLVTTGIFFWIGLLIKEDVRICPVCNSKVA